MMLNIFRIIFVSFLFVSAHCHPLEPVIQIDEQQNDIIDEIIDLSHIGPLMYGEPDERVGKALVEWTPENNSNPEELGSYFEGDMLLPRAEGRNGIVSTASRWPNGIIPYTFQPGFGAESVIRQAIAEYHSKTCLRFVPRTTEKDWIQFENSQTGCWSSVGRVGRRQAVNLQVPGCTTKIGTALHEIMHAVGFLHEQNRSDRDGFVTVVTQNIKEDTLGNFEKADPGTTTAYGVSYDTGSVMHYSSTAFSKNGKKTIIAKRGGENMGQRDGFAPSDLAKINKMYSCDNKPGSSISGGNSGNAGNGNGAQLFGALLGGIGSIISSFGHDDTNHI